MTQNNIEYATALYMLAAEENSQNEVSDSLKVMLGAFSENGEYYDLLSSPAIPIRERLEIIDSAFSSLHEYAVSFLKILCEKMLVRSFPSLCKEYENLLLASSKVSFAKVASAIKLTKEEEKALKEKLEKLCGHTVVIETSVDKNLMGGLVIDIDGKVIDASLRQRLNDVKDVISR
ncbi:MAG: ATP synthase F1 subunit delta [Clostridia bacterium]|nr:ATP synthase F1 subunit delta [Clostridia bacterium]